MGLVHVKMRVRGERARAREIELLVDSGAIYSVLPERIWRALRLRATRELEFSLADGTLIGRRVSDCRFEYRGIEAPSPVVLGEGPDAALLGTVTLESLGLVLNPFDRTLHPMRLVLAAFAGTRTISNGHDGSVGASEARMRCG